MIALIPMREGSKRCINKGIKPLNTLPLWMWTWERAHDCGAFERVFLCTDFAPDTIELPASVSVFRENIIQRKKASDTQTDYEWIMEVLPQIPQTDSIAILRPTNPFRTNKMLVQAYATFNSNYCTSLRAIERVKQHPHKMWKKWKNKGVPENIIVPFTEYEYGQGYLLPTQLLPEVYVQNASLEMIWTKTLEGGDVAGDYVIGYETEGYEGFDINSEDDFQYAEWLVREGKV